MCESVLLDLDMCLNVKTNRYVRVLSLASTLLAPTLGGDLLAWVGICRYLGVYFQVLERLNAVLTTVMLVCIAHLTPFTIVFVVARRLK